MMKEKKYLKTSLQNNVKDSKTEMPLLEKKPSKKLFIIGGSILLFIFLSCTSGYFFYQYQTLKNQLQGNALLTQQQIQQLTTTVGKHVLLPGGLPTVFTVSDVSKLSNQAFFKDAQNGDKVLIYADQKKAILYNPKHDIVINMGPINFTSPQTVQPKIGIRNGTAIAGLTVKIKDKLVASFPNAIIALRDQDKKLTYQKTIVVTLNSSFGDAAANIAHALNASMAKLPSDEIKPKNVDILIIAGKDQAE